MNKLWGQGRKGDELARTTSIRGKISAPIPIVTDDDEFPIRSPGAAVFPTPLAHDGEERRPSVPDTSDRKVGASGEDDADVSPKAPVHRPDPIETSHDKLRRITSDGSKFRESGLISPGMRPEKLERKKGSFRSAIGRLFGRKRKNGSSSQKNGQKTPSKFGHGHHISDPAILLMTDKVTSPKRSASMPINEYNRALTSHSLFGTEGDDDAGNNLSSEEKTRPRRATIPSRLFTDTKGPGYNMIGLSPRPPSGHERASEGEVIGYAVTSGSHPNRRSRSLGHLRTASGNAHTLPRRRSEEIKFWRESYDPGPLSPWSSQRPDTGRSLPDQFPAQGDEENPKGEEAEEAEKKPEPFNFGPMGAMAGMKITQAANIEDRVLELEERLRRVEQAYALLENKILGTNPIFQDFREGVPGFGHSSSTQRLETVSDLPTRISSRDFTSPGKPPKIFYSDPRERSSSQLSSRPTTESTQRSNLDSQGGLSSPPQSSPPIPPRDRSSASAYSPVQSDMGRPLSTSTTIRGVSSIPGQNAMPFSKHGSLTAHHYTALMNLIQAEQNARKQLEVHVDTLQRQLNAVLSTATGYSPSPQPPEQISRPSRDPRRRRISAMEGEFPSNDSSSEYEDEDVSMYQHEDVFQTPAEETLQFEMSEDVEPEPESPPAPRTLSLSQMTLPKGALQSANF